MAKLLRMPEISANDTEAVLQEWTVTENRAFAALDAVATIETDKAAVDIEADADGVLLKILVPAGATVEVGSPIAVIGAPGEDIPDLAALLAELGVGAPAPAGLPTATPTATPAPATPADEDGRRPSEPTPGSTVAAPSSATAAPGSANGEVRRERIFSSPLARRLARDADLPLDELTGTGPGGRIRRSDVEAALAARATAPSATTTTPAATPPAGPPAVPPTPTTPPVAAVASAEPVGFTDVPHSRMRKAIAQRLSESKQTVPHFYLNGSAEVDKLLELRGMLNAAGAVKVSVNDMIIKAAAVAHTKVPGLNVIWTADALRQFSSVDISVAMATERGLVTPVVRSVERLGLGAISATVKDFVARAGDGKLRPAELEGGAFSVTNLGMYGVEDFAAIINPPQSAILAVGTAKPQAVVRDGRLDVGTVMRYTLSVDHRAIDGALAAEWLRAFTGILTEPTQMLL